MRAALVTEFGAAPAAADVDEPSGEGALLELEAVALNPLDVNVGGGRFYGGHPPLPYVPGCEAVGRVGGRRVYAFGDGRGTARDGFCAERVRFPEELLVDVPEDVDAALAASCGIAGIAGWVPVAWRAGVTADDRVLVLGATGVVGNVALQAAKLLGAGRVVAAGRRREALDRALELGADAAVTLDDLAAGFDGAGPTVVIDPLWGAPVAAAAQVAAPGARIVHIGQSAGAEATFPSAAVRGKQLQILGHSNFGLSADDRARAYRELLEHAATGRIAIDLERFRLEDVGAAWERQASGTGKAVVLL
jgi:NADPH:quinone reductase-like Zn-dependent oxidoreductase